MLKTQRETSRKLVTTIVLAALNRVEDIISTQTPP